MSVGHVSVDICASGVRAHKAAIHWGLGHSAYRPSYATRLYRNSEGLMGGGMCLAQCPPAGLLRGNIFCSIQRWDKNSNEVKVAIPVQKYCV